MSDRGSPRRYPPSARQLSTPKLVALGVFVVLLLGGCCIIGATVAVMVNKPKASAPAPTRPKAPSPTATPTSAPTAVVPNEVGKRLSVAESHLDAAGFSDVDREDASGQHRIVLDATNWIVRSQSPAAGARVAAGTRIRLSVVKPTDGRGSAKITPGVVPNVVCKDLQSAQEALRSAGFLETRSSDGTGKGRRQLIDQNWVVIKQSTPPGRPADPRNPITLTVVKYGEPTGSSRCPS